jgi:histidine triad (HIT) family protein
MYRLVHCGPKSFFPRLLDARDVVERSSVVIPFAHLKDVRELDDETGAALIRTVSKITRAVGLAFPNQGLSLWHSIGEAAFQEVPHLHSSAPDR